jgi:hypothetical protein
MQTAGVSVQVFTGECQVSYALQTRDPTTWAKSYACHCMSNDVDVMTIIELEALCLYLLSQLPQTLEHCAFICHLQEHTWNSNRRGILVHACC